MENSLTSWSGSGSAAEILPGNFYRRNTLQVARELLGKILVVRSRGTAVGARIVETEAYTGDDPASHSYRGETPRSRIMFGEPGVAYVYFIYGMYEMLNFVTEPAGRPGAVLIRAAEPVFGEELMLRRRLPTRARSRAKSSFTRHQLTSGPGKLARAMGIRLSHNGKSLQGPELLVLDDGFRADTVMASRRVGISLATELEWRFFLSENPFVSRVKENLGGRRVRTL